MKVSQVRGIFFGEGFKQGLLYFGGLYWGPPVSGTPYFSRNPSRDTKTKGSRALSATEDDGTCLPHTACGQWLGESLGERVVWLTRSFVYIGFRVEGLGLRSL